MHNAYSVHELLKLPAQLSISCLSAFQDHLVIGTKQGTVLLYAIRRSNGHHEPAAEATGSASQDSQQGSAIGKSGGGTVNMPQSDETPRVQLRGTNKNFSKGIVMMEAVPEHSILIVLSNSVVTVHDIDLAVLSFPCIHTVERARGASSFAIDIVRQKTLTGETSAVLRLAVVVRKKIQFFYWKNRKFMDLYQDVSLQDIPRCLSWRNDSVCVGFRGEYSLINLKAAEADKQTLCELFPTGKNQEPRVTILSDERFALCKDEQTTFIDLEGNMKMYAVTWSDTPVGLIQDPPYLIGIFPKYVEIRTEEPRLLIQTLELPGPEVMTTFQRGLVYVASRTHIWGLQMTSVNIQIPQLVSDKQFELAIQLSNVVDEPQDSKTKRVQHIQTLYAFDLFCSQKFKDSMDVFYQLDVDASHVIGLFPDLLPQEFRNQLKYPDEVPKFQGKPYENAILALIDYITQVRHTLNGLASKTINPIPIMENLSTIKSKRHMMQVLDTTLLKCYLKTNDALVAPLLRLKDNQCHLEETERALKRRQKFSELVIFYNTRELHRKALTILKEQSSNGASSQQDVQKTIQYLQNLGPEHIDVILDFSDWVLDADLTSGLTIFTEDMPEVETLPRAKVLSFLQKNKASAVKPYLLHLINQWRETSALFHNSLVLEYKDAILNLMKTDAAAELAQAEEELKNFLTESQYYAAEPILQQFPQNCLHEERALLLGKLGRHKEALAIYLYVLRDKEKAMGYCHQHNNKDEGDNVFTLLVELLLKPLDAKELNSLGISAPAEAIAADVDAAIEVLNLPGSNVDLTTVLNLLPDETPLHKVNDYLQTRLQERVSARNQMKVYKALLQAEHLQVQQERIALESQSFTLTELDVCRVCHKRFGNQGAVVRFPNGEVVHLSCRDKVQQM